MRCHRVQCVYGTVTGKSQSIAEQIYNELVSKNVEVDLYSFEEFGKSWSLDDLDTLIIVCSTTGDGEQPEALTKFWRKLRPKTLSKDFLSHINFTILGLGDTNYNQFCNAPKKLRNRLKELGCSEFYSPGWADDGTGLEIVVEPWLNGLYPSLTAQLQGVTVTVVEDLDNSNQTIESQISGQPSVTMDSTSTITPQLDNFSLQEDTIVSLNFSSKLAMLDLDLPSLPARYIEIDYSDDNHTQQQTAFQNNSKLPFAVGDLTNARVVSNVKLTSTDAVKAYMEMILEIDDIWDYMPGGSFGVCCHNDDQDVSFLISRLKLENVIDKSCTVRILADTKKAKAKIPDYLPCQGASVRSLLKTCLDIRGVPKKLFLRSLVDYTTDPKEKRRLEELCSKQGAIEYMSLVREQNLSFLDVLSAFPSCLPPVSLLAEHLTRLLPRPYSMSTSPLSTANQFGFVYTVVERPKPGLCTTWLSNLQPAVADGSGNDFGRVLVYPRAPTDFRVPDAPDARYIMVCAGSGIGPFLAFLEHRKQSDIKTGYTWLVFGCRHKGRDDLHIDKLNSFLKDGYLNELSIAYSREETANTRPKYVQDVLLESSDRVVKLLTEENASVFVCGDAKNMGKGVYDAFVTIMSKEENNGAEIMKNLVMDKRYKQDLWN